MYPFLSCILFYPVLPSPFLSSSPFFYLTSYILHLPPCTFPFFWLFCAQFLIFTDEPFFNEPGYDATRHTEQGRKQSEAYNAPLRVATLRLAYLDHLKRLNASKSVSAVVARGGNRCVDVAAARMVRNSWCSRGGNEVAQKWADSDGTSQREVILDLIGKIDAEVAALDASKLLD